MKLHSPLFAMEGHIEVSRQERKRPIGKLDSRDGEIRRCNVEGNAFLSNAIRIEHLAECGHAACRTEDGGQNGQRINGHIKERTDLVKGAASGMPGFDAP